MAYRLLAHVRGNFIAYLALFAALGGTAYAGITLPDRSVGAKQLKKNAVTRPKIKAGAVSPSKLSRAARQTLQGPRGETGAQGIQGVQGVKGDKGDTGATGPTFTGFGRNNVNGALPGDGIVVDLILSNGSGTTQGSGPLTLPAQSRVFVEGSATITNVSATEPVRARCEALISQPGSNTLTEDASVFFFADLHQADTDTTGSAAQAHSSIGVTGSALVPAGTYNVGIKCNQIGIGGGTLNRFNAAMNVFAVPASS